MLKPFLAKWHIVIMRPKHQASELIEAVSRHQGTVLLLPMLEIKPLTPVVIPKQSDMTIFTSANAVNHTPRKLWPMIAKSQIYTLGRATTQALSHYNIRAYYTVSEGGSSETLLAHLKLQADKIKGKSILIITALEGRALLAQGLSNLLAHVQVLPVYEAVQPSEDVNSQLAQWQDFKRICWVATSPKILDNLLALAHARYHPWLMAQPLVVISLRMLQQADSLGFEQIELSQGAHTENILQALAKVVCS